MHTLKFLLGFVLLNLYLRLLPGFIRNNEILWLLVFLLFFPLAHVIGKWTSSAGLHEFGLSQRGNWRKLLFRGVLIGCAVWIVATIAELLFGSLQFIAWRSWSSISWLSVQALTVAFLGSATNDVMVRGYVFAHWKDRLPAAATVLLSTALYVADDAWLEGWTLRNVVFSLLLGLAFAISVLRTKSLWMNVGLHAGLNLIYYLVYGFESKKINEGIFMSENVYQSFAPFSGILAAGLLLGITLWITNKSRKTINSQQKPVRVNTVVGKPAVEEPG